MSLLLKKLDQASEDEKKQATPEAEAATAAAPAPGQGAPAATPTPPPTATPPPASAPAPMASAAAPGVTPPPTATPSPATPPPVAPSAAAPPPPPAMDAPAPDATPIEEDIPEAPSPDEMGDEGEGGGGRERKLVSAARVFGASEGESGGGALRAVLALVFVVVLGGGGYFALEASGVNVRALIGLEDELVVVPPPAPPAALAAASSEGAALLPRPAIDVQAEIDFAALSLPQGGGAPGLTEEDSRAQLREQIAIITGYGISSEEEDFGLSEEEQSLIEQEEQEAAAAERQSLEQLAASAPIDAGASREVRQRIEARTPSDNLLEIVRREKGEVSEVSEVEVAQADGGEAGDEAESEAAEGEGEAPAPEVKVDTSKRNEERRKILNRATKLYASGRYAEAEAAYKNILRDAPANLDALRGVALVATATRRYKLAASSYLKILGYYPKDPFAIAELTSLGGGDLDPFEVERILKDLLGANPDIDGRLYFSLGNVYAGQSRWLEAQKAYFDALANESNPDYAYNLAVTLDFLNKPQLAVRYYKEALHLAKGVANVGFDSGEVESRIDALDS